MSVKYLVELESNNTGLHIPIVLLVDSLHEFPHAGTLWIGMFPELARHSLRAHFEREGQYDTKLETLKDSTNAMRCEAAGQG